MPQESRQILSYGELQRSFAGDCRSINYLGLSVWACRTINCLGLSIRAVDQEDLLIVLLYSSSYSP